MKNRENLSPGQRKDGMKVMKKTEVVRLKEADHVKNEADILSR